MNLLNAKLYDPAAMATHAADAALAMTALDTTHLRLAFTIPSHGMVRVRIACPVGGGFNYPVIHLGVLSGASVIGRQLANPQAAWNSSGSQHPAMLVVDFVVTGLAPGAATWDAAYGVDYPESTMVLKYGGPDDATQDNACGGISFEVWDPQPLPTAAPGAANGVLISGVNAGFTVGDMNIGGGFTIGGVVEMEAGLQITANADENAVQIVAQGTGHGIAVTGGADGGHGIAATGGATNGSGIAATGNGTGKGFLATGGAGAGGDGIAAVAGGGVDVRGNVTGNVTGNLSGSVGSVTGAVTVGAMNANVVTANAINSGAFTSAKFADGFLTAAKIAADAITSGKVSADAKAAIAAAILTIAHEGSHTIQGLFRRLEAFMTGKATGLRSATARFYRGDGTTVAIEATQDISSGTRDAASVIGGDVP